MSPSVESMLVRSQYESHPCGCLNGVVRVRSCVAVAVSVVSVLEDMMVSEVGLAAGSQLNLYLLTPNKGPCPGWVAGDSPLKPLPDC